MGGRVEELEEVEGGKNHNQDILWEDDLLLVKVKTNFLWKYSFPS